VSAIPAPLHLPGSGDPLGTIYKEWLHLNFFDHATGVTGLLNTSIHGHPRDRRAIAMGIALAHLPGQRWYWHADIQSASAVALGWSSIAMPTMALAAELPDGQVAASVAGDEITARISARPAALPFDVPSRLPFGSGWISWSVVPRLRLSGALTVGPHEIDLARTSGYHDRNWGRWRWGDDIGWNWAALLAPEPSPVIVISRATDRAHLRGGWLVSVLPGQRRIQFHDSMVTSRWSGRFNGTMPRLPGAMAALQSGRRRPELPERVVMAVGDESSRLEIEFVTRAAAQIIAPEPTARGYTFIHELAGEFQSAGMIAGLPVNLSGLGIFEHVD
jgi:hypothetical protein